MFQSLLSINRQFFTVRHHFEFVLTGAFFIMSLELLYILRQERAMYIVQYLTSLGITYFPFFSF